MEAPPLGHGGSGSGLESFLAPLAFFLGKGVNPAPDVRLYSASLSLHPPSPQAEFSPVGTQRAFIELGNACAAGHFLINRDRRLAGDPRQKIFLWGQDSPPGEGGRKKQVEKKLEK